MLLETELNTYLQEIIGPRMKGFNTEFDDDREVTIAEVGANGQGYIIEANSEQTPVGVTIFQISLGVVHLILFNRILNLIIVITFLALRKQKII